MPGKRAASVTTFGATPSGIAGWDRISRTALCLFLLLLVFPLQAASAQSLVELYRSARFKSQAERVFARYGRRAKVLPVSPVPYPTDSLRARIAHVFPPTNEAAPVEPRFTVEKWSLVPKLGRSWFSNAHAGVQWAYVGSNSWSTIDTTYTRELRARLESEFGSPTQTIADLDWTGEVGGGENIQFEYWFVLNDTIPLLIMDVNGPFERGLVVASDQKYRPLLQELKTVFLSRLARSEKRAPYVDYYYLPEQRMWFLTGFDGERFFLDRISRPDLKLGRPLLGRRQNTDQRPN